MPLIFKRLNYWWVLATCGVLIAIRIAMAFRWKLLLQAQGINVSQIYLTKVLFVSTLSGWMIPGGLGSDIMRGAELMTRIGKGQLVSATIFLDRLIGVYGMLLVATVSGIIAEATGILSGIALPLLITHILIIVGWRVLYKRRVWIDLKLWKNSKLVKKLQEKLKVFISATTNRAIFTTVFPKSLIVSIFINLLRSILFYCLYRAFGVTANFVLLLFITPLIFLAVLIPISIGGLGVREGILAYYFKTVGIEAD